MRKDFLDDHVREIPVRGTQGKDSSLTIPTSTCFTYGLVWSLGTTNVMHFHLAFAT